MWTAIKGGNISSTRAQQENIRLQKKQQQILQSQNGLRSQQASVVLRPSSFLQPFFQEGHNIFFFSFLPPAADRYLPVLMITVGTESHQPLITFSVLEKQGDLSPLLDRKRKTFPLQELTVIDSYSDWAIHTQ